MLTKIAGDKGRLFIKCDREGYPFGGQDIKQHFYASKLAKSNCFYLGAEQ